MIRPLLLVFSTVVSANSLQCWQGIRLMHDHYHITYPPNPVLVTCPASTQCCKKDYNPYTAEIKYCCTSNCDERLRTKEFKSIRYSPPNNDALWGDWPYWTTCIDGLHDACTWNKSIGHGQDDHPNNPKSSDTLNGSVWPPTCS